MALAMPQTRGGTVLDTVVYTSESLPSAETGKNALSCTFNAIDLGLICPC